MNIIKVDFRKNRDREEEALRRFEQAMHKANIKRKIRLTVVMTLLSFAIIGIATLPLIFMH